MKTKYNNEQLKSTIIVAICTALITSWMTFNIITKKKSRRRRGRNDDEEEKEKKETDQRYDYNDKIQLGPEQRPETLYQLNLRGKVDQIYIENGPKPFRFDEEVVSVFDDMVSRSVPLYCEVIDLAIYWSKRYYKPGSRIYDLGCSTGTTIDILARALLGNDDNNDINHIYNNVTDNIYGANSGNHCHFVGVDNSDAMIKSCHQKLEWAKVHHQIDLYCNDLMKIKVENASFVIMNYTLQFIPIVHRQELLSSINAGLCEGGIFLLSEKVRTECSELQETCTWIYEDFKRRRKYTKREIARKKEALMNVLIPFTEEEIRNNLHAAGFSSVEVIAKWNNFTTFIAKKKPPVKLQNTSSRKKATKPKTKISTPYLDALFDPCPVYLSDLVSDSKLLHSICLQRMNVFYEKGGLSNDTLKSYDEIAKMIQELPLISSKVLVVNEDELAFGDKDELSDNEMGILKRCVEQLKPWKKGPLNLFGIHIDTEWRSDWKWKRLQQSLPNLKDKVICDLGCGNGYFMYRMLEYNPKLVVGIDPNLHALLEFKLFSRVSGIDNIKFEYLRGDVMSSMIGAFDVVFCLGVLYHTNDPIGMLKDIHKSMKGKAVSLVNLDLFTSAPSSLSSHFLL